MVEKMVVSKASRRVETKVAMSAEMMDVTLAAGMVVLMDEMKVGLLAVK